MVIPSSWTRSGSATFPSAWRTSGLTPRNWCGKGVPLAGTLDDFTDDRGLMRTFFVYDPDGILVQFDQGPGG